MLKFYKSFQALTIALFLIGQTLAAVHAVEHSTEPGEHDCFVCLSILSDESEGFLPSSPQGVLDLSLIHI